LFINKNISFPSMWWPFSQDALNRACHVFRRTGETGRNVMQQDTPRNKLNPGHSFARNTTYQNYTSTLKVYKLNNWLKA
jgi:hypothetical protein